MKKLILIMTLFLNGFVLPINTVSAQIDTLLEPYFDSYTAFVTSNLRDSAVLMYQLGKISKDTANLKLRLGNKFSGKNFSGFNFRIVGGYGTNTPVRSTVKGSQSSDLDIDMLFKINNGTKADFSAAEFKQQVAAWLRSIYPDTVKYKIDIQEPVVVLAGDTTFEDGTSLKYHIDLASFNQLYSVPGATCKSDEDCSEIAWGLITQGSWVETTAPGFTRNFNKKFQSSGSNTYSSCKMLKYWNKYTNYAPNEDNIPPSVTFLIGAYNWDDTPKATRLVQLKVIVDNLQSNIFHGDCSNVQNANLSLPFYTAGNKNVLRKMDSTSLKAFCTSLKKLSDTLQFVSRLKKDQLDRALLALGNVFPNFSNPAPGIYNMRATSSDNIIYPKNGGVADGDLIVQFTNSNDDSKKWAISNIQVIDSKFYYTISNLKSKKVLNVSGESVTAGAFIDQSKFQNKDSQLWEVLFQVYQDINGRKMPIYKLVNKKSKLFLDATSQSTVNTVIIQNTTSTQNSQKWIFVSE